MGNELNLDVGVLPKELELLLLFMKCEGEENIYSSHEELFINMNWDVFLELARHHRVYPYIYNRVKGLDEQWIPPYVIQELSSEYRKNTFHMLHLTGETDQICQLLAGNEIQVIVLKGPTLALDLYGDLSRRTCSDVDLLTPMENLNKVHELLVKLDYVKEDYFSTIFNEWTWRHHHVTYFHSQKRIKLEIHWRLHPGPSWEPNFNELWSRKRTLSTTSHSIYILGREDLFLFLAAHGARHGWSRLRWLLDIDRMVLHNIDWNKLNGLLKKYHFSQVAGQALILSSQLLDTPLKKEMYTLTSGYRPKHLAQEALFYIKQMVNLHSEPLPEDVSRYHRRHLFSLMSNQQKALFMFSLLYPYPIDAETLPLPRSIHFLYFPLRPFLCAWRKVRNLALHKGI
ncbi:MAG: nucleotidyltransferase family protein [Paenibacillaceae bacterium]